MTPDAQTQAMPTVPTTVVEIREAEVRAPDPGPADARTDWAQGMYEAGLAKLDALHDRWAAAVAEIRDARASSEPVEVAA
jgi:hypothetical protein